MDFCLVRDKNPFDLTCRVAVKCGARTADLCKDAVGDAHVHAGIRSRVFGLEDDANLAITETLFLIHQQPEPLRIALRAQRAIVHDESAPAHVGPA
jgi:hypothetical protein